jgi:hypothetical protein
MTRMSVAAVVSRWVRELPTPPLPADALITAARSLQFRIRRGDVSRVAMAKLPIWTILTILTNLALTAACAPAGGGKSAAMTLDREVFLPRVGGSARALLPWADGGVLVAGGGGTAWALALDNKASQLWRYDEPAPRHIRLPLIHSHPN